MCELKILLWSRKFGSVHFTQKQGFDLLSQNSFFGGWGLSEIIVIYCLYYILIFFGENQVDFVQIFIWKGEVCFRWCVLYMRLMEIFLSASLFLAGYWHGRSVGRHHDIGNVSDHKRRTWGNHIKNDLNCNIPYYHMASM